MSEASSGGGCSGGGDCGGGECEGVVTATAAAE